MFCTGQSSPPLFSVAWNVGIKSTGQCITAVPDSGEGTDGGCQQVLRAVRAAWCLGALLPEGNDRQHIKGGSDNQAVAEDVGYSKTFKHWMLVLWLHSRLKVDELEDYLKDLLKERSLVSQGIFKNHEERTVQVSTITQLLKLTAKRKWVSFMIIFTLNSTLF